MPDLFVVATPIGNLEDMTCRAVRVLSEVSLIAAEDTRKTRILLDKYSIKTPMSSYHKFNVRSKTRYFIDRIKSGGDVALVSDAGMPGISDPGYELVREAVDQGIRVVPIPGASAMTTALAASGLNADKFVFLGFLPKKPGRLKKAFKELVPFDGTIIIYESPYRLLKTLKMINDIMGDRKVVVARELTKKFEEFIRGTVKEVIDSFRDRAVKGEITLLIDGKSSEQAAQSGEI